MGNSAVIGREAAPTDRLAYQAVADPDSKERSRFYKADARVLRLSAIHTQHLLLDRHVVLDGSHAADAARHLDRPGCVSLGSHRAAQSNRTVEGLDADSARV